MVRRTGAPPLKRTPRRSWPEAVGAPTLITVFGLAALPAACSGSGSGNPGASATQAGTLSGGSGGAVSGATSTGALSGTGGQTGGVPTTNGGSGDAITTGGKSDGGGAAAGGNLGTGWRRADAARAILSGAVAILHALGLRRRAARTGCGLPAETLLAPTSCGRAGSVVVEVAPLTWNHRQRLVGANRILGKSTTDDRERQREPYHSPCVRRTARPRHRRRQAPTESVHSIEE